MTGIGGGGIWTTGTGAVTSVAFDRRLGGEALPLGRLTFLGGGTIRSGGGGSGATVNVSSDSATTPPPPRNASPSRSA